MSKMPPVRPLPDVSMNPTTPTTPQAAFAPAAQQAQAPVRGRFITFEGIDGAGKSSQIAAVVALLQASGVDALEGDEAAARGRLCLSCCGRKSRLRDSRRSRVHGDVG